MLPEIYLNMMLTWLVSCDQHQDTFEASCAHSAAAQYCEKHLAGVEMLPMERETETSWSTKAFISRTHMSPTIYASCRGSFLHPAP